MSSTIFAGDVVVVDTTPVPDVRSHRARLPDAVLRIALMLPTA